MADIELGGRKGVPGIAPLNFGSCQSAQITRTQYSCHFLVHRPYRINHPQNPTPPTLCRSQKLRTLLQENGDWLQ